MQQIKTTTFKRKKFILRAFWFINIEIGILNLHQESLAQNFLMNYPKKLLQDSIFPYNDKHLMCFDWTAVLFISNVLSWDLEMHL